MSLTSSSVLHVNSDTELASLISTNHWSGSGKDTDPYVIENLKISDTGASTGIYIGNTTAYLVISKCTVSSSTTNIGTFTQSAAITLYNAGNCTAYNDTCSGYNGIYMESSDSNTISNNNCSGNSNDGIYEYSSNHNIIENNTCNDYIHGIYLSSSSSNILLNNSCMGITRCGIMLSSSGNNILLNNTSSATGNNGLHLDSSSNYNTVSNNTFDKNSNCGIMVSVSSNNNIITHNNCSGNSYDGIYLYSSSSNNIVRDNTCNGNSNDGVCLYHSSNYNTVSNNNCSTNNNCGIYLCSSSSNTITNNTMISNTDYSISLKSSSNNNRLFGNVLINNRGASSTYSSSHVQAYDEGTNFWNTTTYGNYWGDWQSPDANHDGIVDLYYAINGGTNKDYFPLANITINITSPSSTTYTNATSMTVYGTAIDGYGIVSIVWYEALRGVSGTCTGTYTWSADVTLVGGYNGITVTMTDSRGVTLSNSVTVWCSTGPEVIITPSVDSSTYTNNSSTVITIALNDTVPMTSGNMSHYVNGVLVDHGSNDALSGRTSYDNKSTFSLQEGTNVFFFTVNDTAGNSVTVSLIVTCDKTAPTLTITSPTSGSYNNTGSVMVKWIANDTLSGIKKAEISIDGATWINVTGTNNKVLSPGDGTYMVYVRVTDNAGNVNTTSVTFTVDTTKPIVTITSPRSGSYNNTGIVIVKWTASDANGIAKVEISTDGTTWNAVTGTSDTFTGLSDGSDIVYVRATDNAGNVNTTSMAFTVDKTAPTVTVSPTGDNIPLNANIVVKFSEAMNLTSIEIIVGHDVDGDVVFVGNNATFTPSSDLKYNTEYTVTVGGCDLAGNYVTRSWTFNTTKVGDISGTLVDAKGVAIVNATLTLSNGLTTTSDAHGYFIFNNVTVGSYNVAVVRDGFSAVTKGVTVGANATSDLGDMNMAASNSGTSSNSNDTAPIIVAVIVTLAVIAAIGGAFYMRRKPKTP